MLLGETSIMQPQRKVFYFSFRSPYSWLADKIVNDRWGELFREVAYEPFWEPDYDSQILMRQREVHFHYATMSRVKHLYVLQDVRRLADRLRLSFTWPVDLNPWWEPSHLGYLVARKYGRGVEFRSAVYRARWEQGQDISSPQVIGEIAQEVGLDGVELSAVSSNPEVRQEGVRSLEALHKDAVFGVPMFLNGYQKFWGIDRLDDFVDTLRSTEIGTAHAVSVVESEIDAVGDGFLLASGDMGHAGGCG
jgi:2-hydroxychromene-2-carboxylate isomerase